MERRRTAEREESDGRRLDLGELTRAAGVSVRTVRYYIAEGLLPPPAGGGPRSHYTAAHLDRLRLIARLKGAYLPLREIRRRLAGLDDDAVRQLLASGDAAGGADDPLDDAAAYLDRILAAPPPRDSSRAPRPALPGDAAPMPIDRPRTGNVGFEVWSGMVGPPSAHAISDPGPGSATAAAHHPLGSVPDDPASTPMLGRAYPATFPIDDAPFEDGPPQMSETWRRIPLGDDAELLIRDSAYERRRDRVDWLIAWARKVFS